MCFFCDAKHYPSHKCVGQVYRLEIMEEGDWMEEQQELLEDHVPAVLAEEESPLISLQAIQGVSSFQTMRVTAKVGSQPIHILIDSGSTHNFLDSSTAKKLRCELLKIPQLVVVVADRAQLKCQGMCRGFTWTLVDIEYVSDVYLVSLGSYDMVLGV